MSTPTAEEDTLDGKLSCDRVRVFALPFPWRAAPDQQRRWNFEPRSRPIVGSYEKRDALEVQETPDVQEHRQRLAHVAGECL